jgi:hypothetical protein
MAVLQQEVNYMERKPWSRLGTVWALVVLVVLLVAGCTGSSHRTVASSPSSAAADPTLADPCSAAAMRSLVSDFVDAFNAGNSSRLDALWASAAQGFVWYTVGPPQAAPSARDRTSLLDYFASRHGVHEQLTMTSFTYNGRGADNFGNFEFAFGRRADDLPALTYSGKGAAFCRAGPGQLFVWAMTSI